MVTEWIITEIDGKIASIAGDYGHFAELAAKIAQLPPTSVAINEAVELTKKYENEEMPGFVNGVLGGFVRGEKIDS